jgi:formylglycine-generating enzyme
VFDVESGEWTKSDGVNWRRPTRKNSTANSNETIFQILLNYANDYAKFSGKRVSNEAHFEYAARGGLIGKKYAPGNDLKPKPKSSRKFVARRIPF